MIFSSSVSHQDCRPPSSHSANTLSPSHPLSCFHLPSSWKIHPNVTVTSHFTFKKINVLSYLIRTKPLTINLDWTAFSPTSSGQHFLIPSYMSLWSTQMFTCPSPNQVKFMLCLGFGLLLPQTAQFFPPTGRNSMFSSRHSSSSQFTSNLGSFALSSDPHSLHSHF